MPNPWTGSGNPYTRKEVIERLRETLRKGRPIIAAGAGTGISAKFIEKGGLPCAWTILGMSAIPTDHPLAVGMLGMHGNYGPNVLTNECDVLIAVGMRFGVAVRVC